MQVMHNSWIILWWLFRVSFLFCRKFSFYDSIRNSFLAYIYLFNDFMLVPCSKSLLGMRIVFYLLYTHYIQFLFHIFMQLCMSLMASWWLLRVQLYSITHLALLNILLALSLYLQDKVSMLEIISLNMCDSICEIY